MTRCVQCNTTLGTYEFNHSDDGVLCDSCAKASKKQKVSEPNSVVKQGINPDLGKRIKLITHLFFMFIVPAIYCFQFDFEQNVILEYLYCFSGFFFVAVSIPLFKVMGLLTIIIGVETVPETSSTLWFVCMISTLCAGFSYFYITKVSIKMKGDLLLGIHMLYCILLGGALVLLDYMSKF